MKKSKLSIMVLLSIAIFASCKKDDTQKDTNTTNELLGIAKVKTVSYLYDDGSNYTETLQYDAKGRLIKIVSSDGIITYEYPDETTVIEKDVMTVATKNSITTTSLNDKGQAVNSVRTGYDPGSWTETFDANGFSQNSGSVNTVENGNVVKNVSLNRTDIYEFYLDKTNTIGYKNMGISYLGNDDKNLVKKETEGANETGTHTYLYDTKGRVIAHTAIYSGSKPGTDVETYTYYE